MLNFQTNTLFLDTLLMGVLRNRVFKKSEKSLCNLFRDFDMDVFNVGNKFIHFHRASIGVKLGVCGRRKSFTDLKFRTFFRNFTFLNRPMSLMHWSFNLLKHKLILIFLIYAPPLNKHLFLSLFFIFSLLKLQIVL